MTILFFKRLLPNALTPVRARPGDAGYDLFNAVDAPVYIRPGERMLFTTGIAAVIPLGFYGRIADRSGLALKGLHVLGGVVDSSYRGSIGVILLNTNGGDESQSIIVEPGQRIAQLIIERCYDVIWEEVESLPASERAAGGFGSTGT